MTKYNNRIVVYSRLDNAFTAFDPTQTALIKPYRASLNHIIFDSVLESRVFKELLLYLPLERISTHLRINIFDTQGERKDSSVETLKVVITPDLVVWDKEPDQESPQRIQYLIEAKGAIVRDYPIRLVTFLVLNPYYRGKYVIVGDNMAKLLASSHLKALFNLGWIKVTEPKYLIGVLGLDRYEY